MTEADKKLLFDVLAAFRNRIIHGYDTVDDTTVWGILQQHVPVLKVEVTALLQE